MKFVEEAVGFNIEKTLGEEYLTENWSVCGGEVTRLVFVLTYNFVSCLKLCLNSVDESFDNNKIPKFNDLKINKLLINL